jgi:uncharacterized protein YjbI with pentapeptide repeats
MANAEHLELLRQGVAVWNKMRPTKSDLSGADLRGANLSGANLIGAHLSGADLSGADLRAANLGKADLRATNLSGANLIGAHLSGADLIGADLRRANLSKANFGRADLRAANLSEANLNEAILTSAALIKADIDRARLTAAYLAGAKLGNATLRAANLEAAQLMNADLSRADLNKAILRQANLSRANLTETKLVGADLSRADLSGASFVQTNLEDADLTGCRIYGISVWKVKLSKDTKQQDLVITPPEEPTVVVDNIEVAQFVYLLLHDEKIRDVIDTVGKKGVLLLGRFTEGRIAVLERLREELRKLGYLPIVFNFKPDTKTFTETIRVLAGLSRFVIADVTDPQSVPAELQAVVPTVMVPFLPIIEKGKKPFALLEDLRIEHGDRMFKPFSYPSLDALAAALEVEIIKPAETRFAKLQARKRRR